MAEKDYSGSKYFTGTPEVKKVGKIPVPTPTVPGAKDYSKSKYVSGVPATTPVTPQPQKGKKLNFIDEKNQEFFKLRDSVVGGVVGAANFGIGVASHFLAKQAGRDKAIQELAARGIITPYMEGVLKAKATPPSMPGAGPVPSISLDSAKLGIKANILNEEDAKRIDDLIKEAADQNAGKFLTGDKTVYGLEVLYGDKPSYEFGDYVMGFVYDVMNDPLTFAGSGTVSVVKAALTGGAAAAKGGAKALFKGEVSLPAKKAQIVKKGQDADIPDLPIASTKEPKIKVKQSELKTSKTLGFDAATELERIKKLGTYTTTSAPTLGKLNLDLGLITSSALEAGKKAALSSLRQDALKDTLADVLKGNVSRTAGLVVAREGDKWAVKTTAGENVGTATSKKEARDIAKEAKKAVEDKQVGKAAIKDIPEASLSNEGKTVEVPSQDGDTLKLDINKPYEASDGSAWVFDGTSVKVFGNINDAQLSLIKRPEAPNATVRKSKDAEEFTVRAGDYIEAFKTRAEANAAAEAYNTGKVAAPAKIAGSKRPALDISKTPELSLADIGKGKVTSAEGKALKQVLSKVDALSRKTPGRRIRLAMADSNLLRTVINKGTISSPESLRYLYRTFREDFQNAIKLAKVDGERETPYTLLKMLDATSSGGGAESAAIKEIYQLVKNTVVRVDKSTVAIGDLEKRFKDFVKDVPPYVTKQVGEKLQGILDEAALISKSKNIPAITEQRRYDKLAQVFGEDVANRIKATGVLQRNAENKIPAGARDAYYKLEEELLNQYENITYNNVDELINGLRNGESVNPDALIKIFREIDPDTRYTRSTLRAMDGGTGEVIRDVFINEVPQTIDAMKRKLAVSGNVDELLGANGIGYDTILAEHIKYLQQPSAATAAKMYSKTGLSPQFIEEAVNLESPAALAKAFSEEASPVTGKIWSAGDDMVTEALRESWVNKLDLETRIEKSADFVETVSSLGDVVKKVSKQSYVSETGAVLPKVFTQADEMRAVGKLTALIRARISKKVKAGKIDNVLTPANVLGREKQLELRNAGADNQIDEFIFQMKQASRILGTLGIRVTRVKEANDWAFKADYAAEAARAKAENRPMQYNKAESAHFAYLDMGDIFESFVTTGGRDILRRGYFPVTTVDTYSKNTMPFMGFGDAARRVLELDSRGQLVIGEDLIDELAKRIMSKSEKMDKPTKAFAALRPGLAREMAEHLLKPEVINYLKNRHLMKSVADAERWVREGKTVSDDILNNLRDGMRAADAVGETSDAVRIELVRQYLRRLALAGNLFALQGGRYAEDIFNAYAMQFAIRGNLPPSAETAANTTLKILDEEERALLRTHLYMLDMHVAPERAQIQAASGFKYKTAAEIQKVETALTFAQEQFSEVVSRVAVVRQGGKIEIAEWEKEFKAAQTLLNKARKKASESGVPTFHYQAGTWVPSDQYRPEIAIQLAEEAEAAYVAGQSGLMARTLIDEVPVIPEYKILKGKKLEEALKRESLTLTETRINSSRKAADVIESQAAKELDSIQDDDLLGLLAVVQEAEMKKLANDMELPRAIGFADDVNPEVLRVDTAFQKVTKTDKGDVGYSTRERFSAVYGKEDLAQFARMEEGAGLLRSNRVANALRTLQRQYSDLSVDEFGDALNFAVARGDLPSTVSGQVRQLALQLRKLVGPIREAAAELNKDGIIDSLARMGLSDKVGYNIDKGQLSQSIEHLFDSLPFVKKPGLEKTDAAQEQIKRFDAMIASGTHPIELFENLVKAISVAKAEQGIAANIVANFGWKSTGEFKTIKEAVEVGGYVAVESTSGGSSANIIKAMGSAKDGALFPPEIAKQIGAVSRHWNEVMNIPREEAVQIVAQFTGFAKVFMTVNRLGYHAQNLVNDLSTALIRGTSAADLVIGTRLAGIYVAETLPAEYGRLTDALVGVNDTVKEWVGKITGTEGFISAPGATSLERQIRLVTKSWGKEADAIKNFDANPLDAMSMKVVGPNGKISRRKLDPYAFVDALTRSGVFEKNLIVNNIQNLEDAIALDPNRVGSAKFLQKAGARINRATQVAGKIGGDFSSTYSNAIRAAHAMKILRSRAWRSMDEAVGFIADELAVWHPTSKSLGSFERRNSPLISTFYTWERMAHVMTFKMMLENYRELHTINKAIYTINQMGGNEPQNTGTPYEEPDEVADWFRFRVGQIVRPGGSNMFGLGTSEEAIGFKVAITPFDIANNYMLHVDVDKSINENSSSVFNQIGQKIARSTPVVAQTASKLLFGVDYVTRADVPRETLGDYANIIATLFPAVSGPVKGFAGGDVPAEIGDFVDSITGGPIKPRDKKMTADQQLVSRLNTILGIGAYQPESEASKRRADYLERQRRKEQLEQRREERKERKRRRKESQ